MIPVRFFTARPSSFHCLFFLCEIKKSLKITAASDGPLFFIFAVYMLRERENFLLKIL
jgi:hypothetical protein